MDSYGGIQRSKRGGIRTGVFLLVPSREHLSLAGLCPRLIWKEGHSVGQLQNGSVGDNEREIIAALSGGSTLSECPNDETVLSDGD